MSNGGDLEIICPMEGTWDMSYGGDVEVICPVEGTLKLDIITPGMEATDGVSDLNTAGVACDCWSCRF